MLFKKKVTIADYCSGKLARLFSGEREATWDNLRARCNDPALNRADRNLYYDNLRAAMIALMGIAVVKNCNVKSSIAAKVFVGNYLKVHGLDEIDRLGHEYSQAFGSPYSDGVALMVQLFADKVTESKMAEPAKQQFYTEFYAILGALFEEFKSIKLVGASPDSPDLRETRASHGRAEAAARTPAGAAGAPPPQKETEPRPTYKSAVKVEELSTEEKAKIIAEYAYALYKMKPEDIQLAEALRKASDEDFELAKRHGLIGRGAEGPMNASGTLGGESSAACGGVRAERLAELLAADLLTGRRYGKPVPEGFTELIASEIAKSFSTTKFAELFKDQTLAGGWAEADALATWFSVGYLALVVAAWKVLNDEGKLCHIMDECRLRLLKHWKMLNRWGTEGAEAQAFTSCQDGAELLRFFARYVNRILGNPEIMVVGNESLVNSADPILAAQICHIFVATCSTTKELLENCSIDWGPPESEARRARQLGSETAPARGARELAETLVDKALRRYAAELRTRLGSDGPPYLTQPVLGCDLIGEGRGAHLVNWLYFNPLGPSACSLIYVPVPQEEKFLLGFLMENPFSRQNAAFALIPAHDDDAFRGTLVALFLGNGDPTCPLVESLPTSVLHRDNCEEQAPLLESNAVRTLFYLALRKIKTPDLAATCEYLRRYRGDPWARTKAEAEGFFLERMAGRSQGSQEELEERQFDEWFDLVTNPDHVRSELNNFQGAWQLAIKNASAS